MTRMNFEQWLHASDRERETLLHHWRADTDEGRPIVKAVAELFQRECVYEVDAADIAADGTRWLIHAYLTPDDYALLGDRTAVKFLGIPVRFNESRASVSTH